MPKPSRWPRCVTRFGVVPICRALAVHGVQIAPRTYWAHRSAAPSKRALWDATITEILAIYEPDAAGKRPPEWPVRQPEDVGAPAPPGHPGGTLHGGTDHARQRLARGDPGAHRGPTSCTWPTSCRRSKDRDQDQIYPTHDPS